MKRAKKILGKKPKVKGGPLMRGAGQGISLLEKQGSNGPLGPETEDSRTATTTTGAQRAGGAIRCTNARFPKVGAFEKSYHREKANRPRIWGVGGVKKNLQNDRALQ